MEKAETYRYEFVSADTFFSIFKKYRDELFDNAITFDVEKLYSQEEKDKASKLTFHPLGIYLLAYDGDQLIGWSFGQQQQKTVFCMTNSAVFELYRRKGIYTCMAQLVVNKATEIGFQKIYSRHKISNNAVIIAKLKLGFMIGGIELSDRFGALVRLNYFPNRARENLFRYRAGEKTLPSQFKEGK